MKNCSFSITFRQSAEEVVHLAGSAISSAGGEFTGDLRQGQFRLSTGIGSVKGAYTISGEVITITVSDKPALVGCGRIEKEIRRYLDR